LRLHWPGGFCSAWPKRMNLPVERRLIPAVTALLSDSGTARAAQGEFAITCSGPRTGRRIAGFGDVTGPQTPYLGRVGSRCYDSWVSGAGHYNTERAAQHASQISRRLTDSAHDDDRVAVPAALFSGTPALAQVRSMLVTTTRPALSLFRRGGWHDSSST